MTAEPDDRAAARKLVEAVVDTLGFNIDNAYPADIKSAISLVLKALRRRATPRTPT